MRTATRVLTCAVATTALAALAPAATTHATPAQTVRAAMAVPGDDICRYVVTYAKKPVPLKSGPGRRFDTVGTLPVSADPIVGSCAIRGKGAKRNWVQIRRGAHEGRWIWRDHVQVWGG
jgi:uncharacterized protein YgiM (DUF1202 family)